MENWRRAVVPFVALVILSGCGTTLGPSAFTTGGNPQGGLGAQAATGSSESISTGGRSGAIGGSGTGSGGASVSSSGASQAGTGYSATTNAGGGFVPGASSVTATTSPGGSVMPAPGEGPAGTATGVTAKTIDIGLFTVEGFSTFASSIGVNVATGDQAAEAKAVISYINAHGGIAGRQIVPVIYDENVGNAAANPSSEYQSACSAWTQDAHVYTVASPVGTIGDTLYQCLAKAGVITASEGESRNAEFFQQYANTFYEPADMNLTRILRDNVNALYGAGFFGSNPKIGVVLGDDPGERAAVNEGLIPALEQHGLHLTDQYAISESGASNEASDYSSAVLKFKAEGITHVLFTFIGNPLLFMTNAHTQEYHPRYGLNSRNSPAALLEGNAPNDQLQGSMGIGWQQYNDVDAAHDPGPTGPQGALCLKLLQQAGQDTSVRATALVGLWICDLFFFLRDAIDAAPNFTEAGFRAGAESLSDFPAASTFHAGFRPGQLHDGAGTYRLFAYGASCSCYEYVSAQYPAQ